MKYYQMLDHRFTSELRVAHHKNQTDEATLHVYDGELREYKKIVPQLRPSDWKQVDLHFDEKPLGWKFRLANCLRFADIKAALPFLIRLYETGNPKIQVVVKEDLESRQAKSEIKGLSPEETKFVSLILGQKAAAASESSSPAEAPSKFRNKIYSQKNLNLEGFLLWRWKKGRSTYICCYGIDKVVDQWREHLAAGIELAEHFGETFRTYSAAKPTDAHMGKIGSAFFLKSLKVVIYDKRQKPEQTIGCSVENESGEVLLTLEISAAQEMTETLLKRKSLWIEPPYIGWDLLDSEEVFLLPSLPDKDGEWLKK